MTPAPVPKGPPSATLTLAGTAGLSGSLAATALRCFEPGLEGMFISVDTTVRSTGQFVRITINAGKVTVRAAAGSGQQATARQFEGSGVSGFDPTAGAHLDSPLAESSPRITNPGTIGAATAISGAVVCGNQKPGSTTITVTGTTRSGPVSGGLSSARVECDAYPQARYVQVVGLSRAGSTPLVVLVFIGNGSVSVSEGAAGAGASGFFTAKGAGVGTANATGGHISADLVESVGAGATPHTLTVKGDATCGSTVVSS